MSSGLCMNILLTLIFPCWRTIICNSICAVQIFEMYSKCKCFCVTDHQCSWYIFNFLIIWFIDRFLHFLMMWQWIYLRKSLENTGQRFIQNFHHHQLLQAIPMDSWTKKMVLHAKMDFNSLINVIAASLGQVYKGRLKETGDLVAVKVQRPYVLETVTIDLFIIRKLGMALRRFPQASSSFSFCLLCLKE